METARTGVLITKCPQDWQIFQQKGGYADIALEGTWNVQDNAPGAVYARVAREDTGESVLTWTKAEPCGENRWKLMLRGVPVGGLYRVETGFLPEGGMLDWLTRGDMVHHLAVGDLYVIAGQSNSAGYGRDMAYDPPEPGVHLLRNSGRWDMATHPMNESTGIIHPANLEGCNPGHSPWLSFAKTLKREAGMPVGLLQASLGGSALDQWMPGAPLYVNMMQIIAAAGSAVRGILWYQGCTDAVFPQCETYLDRFTRFVSSMRKELCDPGLPFVTMQLCRHLMPPDETMDRAWSMLREAQRQAARTIPGVYVVTNIDSSMSDGIHLSAAANITLGDRAARIALAKLYGKRILWEAPDIEGASRTQGGLLLRFRGVAQRLYLYCDPQGALPFRVEDEAGLVPVTGYEFPASDEILLQTERTPLGRCTVSSHYGRYPHGAPVVDCETRIPAPAFYGVKAN